MQDRLLTMALTAYEDSMCPDCGQPKDVAYNPDAEGWFEAHEITCAGCAAKHVHGSRNKKPAPGAKVYVVDGRPPGLELMPWQMPSRTQDQAGDD